jgi:hypothetical protein
MVLKFDECVREQKINYVQSETVHKLKNQAKNVNKSVVKNFTIPLSFYIYIAIFDFQIINLQKMKWLLRIVVLSFNMEIGHILGSTIVNPPSTDDRSWQLPPKWFFPPRITQIVPFLEHD